MIEEDLNTIPRIYTALAEWLACLAYVLLLKRRFKGFKFAAAIALALAAQIVLQHVAGILPISLWVPGMIASVCAMFAFIYATCKTNVFTAGCRCAQAFVVAEFSASLAWQFSYYFAQIIPFSNETQRQIFINLVILAIFALVNGLVHFLESRYMKRSALAEPDSKDFFMVALIATLVFFVSNISFLSIDTPFSGKNLSEIFYIRTLVDFSGLVILFALREQKLWLHAQGEIDAMQSILNKHYCTLS